MPDWFRLKILSDFLTDLLFDTPEEGQFKSSHFNTRKFFVVCLIVFLFSGCALLLDRVYYLVYRVQALSDTIENACYPYADNLVVPRLPFKNNE